MTFPERPLLLFWEVTRACPLRCLHCRADAQEFPLPGELSLDEGLRLWDAVRAFGPPRPTVILTGGDPLGRPDLLDLVRGAVDRGLRVALSPAVSVRLTSALLRRCADAGVLAFSVSLDAAHPSRHDALRGRPGTYDATLRAIEEAQQAGLKVQVNTTVLRRHLGELPGIAALLRERSVRVWEVFFLVRTGRASLHEEPTPREAEAVGHFLYDVSRSDLVVRPVEGPFCRRIAAERRGGSPPPPSAEWAALRGTGEALGGARKTTSTLPTSGTLDGDGILFVAYDGTLQPGGFTRYPLGNVRTDDLVTTYREHPALLRIRRRQFGGPCGACAWAGACGGSRARSWAATGDLFGSDPLCPFSSSESGSSPREGSGPLASNRTTG